MTSPSLFPLSEEPPERRAVQRVLEGAPAYFTLATGAPAGPDAAATLYRDLPPGRTFDDKRLYGISLDAELIGVVDVILRWPGPESAMVGLFLLHEAHHRRGVGRAAFRLLEADLREQGFARTRIAVIEGHASALAFWRAQGFVETGERKLHSEGTATNEVIVFEKPL